MALLEPPAEPSNKTRHLIFTAAALVVIAAVATYYSFRFYPEQKAAQRFFDTLVVGDMNGAYRLWKAGPSYRIQDFMADWGPYGYYGPVKSYKVKRMKSPNGPSNNVIAEIEVSPFSPMPDANDTEKSRRTRTVTVWVNSNDKSLSFPP
jgi:hypothetical protein